MTDISTKAIGSEGVEVRFPKDRAVIAALKAAFPRARWRPWDACWWVPGKTAEKRVRAWAEGFAQASETAQAERRAAIALVVENMRPGPLDLACGYAYGSEPFLPLDRAPDIPSIAAVLTPLGATYDGKRWCVPPTAIPRLREPDIHDALNAACLAHYEAVTRLDDERAERIKSPLVRVVRPSAPGYLTVFRVKTPYAARIVALLRGIDGAKWDDASKDWCIPAREKPTEQLAAVLPEVERIVADIRAAESAAKAATERERLERYQALERRRYLELWSCVPAVGSIMRASRTGDPVHVEDIGKPFRVDENMPSLYGSWLLGYEGDRCAYVYFRPATEAEAAGLLAREQAMREKIDALRAARTRLDELEKLARGAGDFPKAALRPDGERLIESDAELRLVGGGWSWVAAEDGLWYVEGHGMDGDAWDWNNIPGAMGWRLPRSPEIEAELRQIAATLNT